MSAKKTEIEDAFNKGKAWYQSKTIIGVIIAAGGAVAQMIWPESGVDPQAVVDVIVEDGEGIAQHADNIWFSLVEGFGLLMATWGRIKAHTGIK